VHPRNATPAPWLSGVAKIPSISGDQLHIAVVQANNTSRIIAILGLVGSPDEAESIANSHLVAAAPELLAALEEMTRFVKTICSSEPEPLQSKGNQLLNRAHEAIASAKPSGI
jgi:hypothetical protein